MNISTLYPRAIRHSPISLIPFLLLLVFFIGSSNLHAAGVSLTWNKNNESDLAGYKIYKRLLSTNDYGSALFSGFPSNRSAPQLTVNNLNAGTTYGFIPTAFDTSGNKSAPSREKQITTKSSSGSSSGSSGSDSGSSSDGSGSSSSGSFPTPMSAPAPGKTLTSTTVTVTGGYTSQDTAHWIDVSTRKGGNNLHNSGLMTSGHSELSRACRGPGRFMCAIGVRRSRAIPPGGSFTIIPIP